MSQLHQSVQKKNGTHLSSREARLLAENCALQRYKDEVEIMEKEAQCQALADISARNREVLVKYKAKRAKVITVKTKKSRVSKTSIPDEESVSTDDDVSDCINDSWEVAPDPSKPCTEGEGAALDDDHDDEIIKVLNHRKRTGGMPEMLTEWNNGETSWADVALAFEDAPSVVSKYIGENDLFDTAFEPNKMKRGKTDKTATPTQHDGKKTSPQAKQMECSHDDYRTEIGGYRPETDSWYFVLRYGMAGCFCAVCKTKFVPVGTTSKEQFRPSSLKPAFICTNRLQGCFHSVCYDCFTSMDTAIEGSKRIRSTRNNN